MAINKNEDKRLKALHNYAILNSASEIKFDRLTELASIICNTPISLISLIDEHRQWFKSNVGLDVAETPREHSFCGHTIMGEQIFEVDDAMTDDRFKDNPLVTGNPNIRFYAGYPLIDPDGYALGSLCVIDRTPKLLTPEQKRALELLSAEVTALIVERRQKEELKYFEKLFNLSNNLIFIGGTDGYFKKVNPAFTKVLGWEEEHLLNTSSFEFYHPDDVQKTVEELKSQSEGKETVNFLQRFKTVWGYYKTIAWTWTPDTATGSIFGIGRDVSDSILKEQILAESQEKLHTFFENSQGLMCTHDLQGNFLSVNQAGAAILGYTVAEVMQYSLFDIVPGYGHEQLRNYLAEVKLKGRAKGQMLTLHKDGSLRMWMFNNALQTAVGGETYVIANAIDITERHKLEESLKRLNKELLDQIELIEQQDKTIEKIQEFKFFADSIPQMVWTSKSDGGVDYYNEHWFNFTGLDLEHIDEHSWENVLHPEDVKADEKAWLEAVKTGMPYQNEVRFKRAADGVYKWHRANAIPMKDASGKVVKWFGSGTDIDEYKRALDLENRISQFEDFNRIVAHNLRGPAGSIQMITSMITDDDTKEETEEYMAMLKESSDSLIATLNELMKVLEIRNNKNLPFETCNFEATVSSVKSMLKGQIVAKQAIINTHFEVPAMQFPKMYLDSIFYNMISNALKYSKADAVPVITISSIQEKGKLKLLFSDNGIGIDLARHGKDMFKLNQTFHSGFDSKGVGLFMTKTQIETFGGQISVKSEPDIGTEFEIDFG
jgi:PAS domain S-box-containing protein